MIHKLITQQWIVLIIGVVFLLISVYTLFRGIKRDKIIAISIFSICLVFYIVGEVRIRTHNSKAKKYFGVYKLVNYNNSENYRIEILPNNAYMIFKDQDTIVNGKWELSVSKNNSTMLLLDGRIFGIGELEIK